MNPDPRGGPRRQSDRATEIVAREAALFITREAGTESLITVIGARSMSHGERIGVFVSVFPVEKAPAALSFLERKREAFSNHLKSHTRLRLPRVDFLLENGEHTGGPGGN
ncbi:hypothetical protein HKL94_01545 [Candidatus Parcubacteria bacterium]|nr:hypothetical protein [Candidatus Parcubacteria bacterium]